MVASLLAEHELSNCQDREGTSRVQVWDCFATLTPRMKKLDVNVAIDRGGRAIATYLPV